MIRKASHFARHWLGAQTRYAVHSPFVYEFVTRVLPHRPTEHGGEIEALRKRLLRDSRPLDITDFGAGYGGQAQRDIQKSIAEVARSSARSRREGELLLRMVRHYGCTQLLEFGTNLGVGTSYLAAGLPSQGQLTSLEGSAALSQMAEHHLQELGLKADLRVGAFEDLLPQLEEENICPDFVLLDGNHRYDPTMAYMEWLLPRLAEAAVIVLDDINWSEGMQRAWQEIQQMREVTVSIDLFFLGICFVRRPQAKEHFQFRFRP